MIGLMQGGQGVQSAARGQLDLYGDLSLADPWFLLLLPVGLLLTWWGRGRRGRAYARVPLIVKVPRSARQNLAWVPTALQLTALVLAVGALSRPLRENIQNDVVSEGVDICLVVDRSSSMRFNDLERGRTRLDVVKEVVGEFAERRMSDREGAADNCSLITFARYPHLLCPFTLDVGALEGFLEDVELVEHREEDGTAIGVALAKAVSVLRESDAKAKVCVLLTDGENNVDDIRPDQAAELAAEEGIRVYTIYAARYIFRHDPFRGWVPTEGKVDTSALERMADLTGGRFYHASDKKRLQDIYGEIEALERTERTERRYEETFDLYLYLLIPAILAYGLGWISATTWARRIL
ncbi:MAG: hypothetical protein CMJ89_10685 [Planctomycetes bacterium]|nr:hypothetical protein [Planctomycetota bacterium]